MASWLGIGAAVMIAACAQIISGLGMNLILALAAQLTLPGAALKHVPVRWACSASARPGPQRACSLRDRVPSGLARIAVFVIAAVGAGIIVVRLPGVRCE